MKIKVKLQETSSFSATDLFGIIDFIVFETSITSFTSTSFTGAGSHLGVASSYTATGSGFMTSLIGSDVYVTGGTLDAITFSSRGETVTFENVAIEMGSFTTNIILPEENGSNVLAAENYFQARSWNIKLGNQDDLAPKGIVFGDGAVFNLMGSDAIQGGRGADNLFSGDGSDRLEGGLGNDKLDGGNGRDKVFGGGQNDVLKGGRGDDYVDGGNGKDLVFGGGGNDVIVAGRGNDTLSGGAGFDTFVFADLDGVNYVSAFDLDDRETIDLSAVSRITGFNDLVHNHMSQVGNQTVIDDGAGLRIVLLRIDMDDLGAGDFDFV